MHDDLKQHLRREIDAGLGGRPSSDLSEVLRRGRGKRVGIRVMATVSVVLVGMSVVGGGLWIGRSLSSDDATPLPPAEEREQDIEGMRNGRILHQKAGDMYWEGSTPPPPPGGDESYHWNAFDQETGSFLYDGSIEGRVWVVDEDGLVAELDCPTSLDCGSSEALGYVPATAMATFGPGPDEITVPSPDSRSLHVIGFDGTLRDTIEISAVFSPGQYLSDVAWSPDGDRLAISTGFELSTRCGGNSGPCGKVWILAPDAGEPQEVYTERATGYTVLRDLAWSSDGNTLALLVAPAGFCEAGRDAPRLVALRMTPDEPVRAETVNVYDDWGFGTQGRGCTVPTNYHLAFPFAWSPDGTRIAVTTVGGITEISARNGEVLAQHPVDGAEGPLAWLPKR